uniref:CWF19-like protein 2 n=1 Tax=Sphaeramia orbicularis TaxID=375764 RepID=A0A672Z521_9TELE
MAAHGISFESASSIEDKKESKRQARQEALEKAKKKYEKEERRKELKRQRGEDTWMLPEVNQRLQQIEEESSVKSKKKKEKKSKKKKEKKRAKKEKRAAEANDGSSESSEVRNQSRDEWMTFDFLAMKTTSTADRRAEKERQKEEERAKADAIQQAGLHKLELNPYWKDGGTGLPPEDMSGTAVKKGAIVNDGGLSWLRKSYQRMKEQAEREQRSINDVVAERYGSMEEFQNRLSEAEEAAYEQRRGRGGDNTTRGGWRKDEGENRERWKQKEGDGPEKDRWRRSERERHSSERNRERDRDRDRERDRERHRDRSRPGAASSSEQPWSSLSTGSLKGRFLKPSDDDDSAGGGFRSKVKASLTISALPSIHIILSIFVCIWSDSDSEEGEEEEEAPLLSEEEMNKLGAKLVKAEIMGNKVRRLLICQMQKMILKTLADRSSEDQEVLLFRTDQSGRAWPVNAPSGSQEPHGGRRKKKPIETHVDGQRVRYFQDDDNMGLMEMVRREKMSTAQDQNALYSRMASKMMGKTDGDNYTLDDMFVSSAAQREGEGREEERMRNRAIGESRRLAAFMEKCHYCFNSQELQKHLIVALGSKVYLSLPAGVSMTEGHCLICPLQHHCSATGLDEDIWSEMQLFRRALVRMFESQELDCVFMETHMNPRRRQHMVLECIPLPRELGDMAPIYFKKAIMECDEEWAMNKKVVDLSSKDVRQAVPRGLPYFAVDFGLQGGFAHVIENEQKFPPYFGKEVVGGMMDLEPRRWRKAIRENFDDQRKKVLQFAQWWKPYDCTKTDD